MSNTGIRAQSGSVHGGESEDSGQRDGCEKRRMSKKTIKRTETEAKLGSIGIQILEVGGDLFQKGGMSFSV